jgi:DNA-directed RNA polymerase specialized sigma24 family protein
MTQQKIVRLQEIANDETVPASLSTHDARRTTLPWDFDLTPAIEDHLNALAFAARTEPVARNELHRLLSGKIARFLAPWRGQELAIGDFADLCQESFLVFVGLVDSWKGRGSFVRYFFGFFHWRLRHALEAHKRRWPTERLLIIPERDLLDSLLTEDNPHDPLLPFWPLTADDRLFLALRLLGGYSLTEIAQLFGWSRRTTFRRWRELTDRLASPEAEPEVQAS